MVRLIPRQGTVHWEVQGSVSRAREKQTAMDKPRICRFSPRLIPTADINKHLLSSVPRYVENRLSYLIRKFYCLFLFSTSLQYYYHMESYQMSQQCVDSCKLIM